MIILPEYSSSSSSAGLDYNAGSCLTMERFDNVVTINCDKLAGYGGILHCTASRIDHAARRRCGRFSEWQGAGKRFADRRAIFLDSPAAARWIVATTIME
jgi:hypothetical protein